MITKEKPALATRAATDDFPTAEGSSPESIAHSGVFCQRCAQRNLEKFLSLYIHNRESFAIQKENGGYPLQRGWLRDEKILAHLCGDITLSVFPHFLKRNGKAFSRWLSFDVDFLVRPPNQQVEAQWFGDAAHQIRAALSGLGLDPDFLTFYATGGKGFRAELHLSEPMGVKAWLRFFESVMHYGEEGSRLIDRQDLKIEPRPTGSLQVRPPLSFHRRTGAFCGYLDSITMLPVEDQVSHLHGIKTMHPELLRSVKPPPEANRQRRARGKGKGVRAQIDAQLEGFLPEVGTRHQAYPFLVARLREKGYSAPEARELMVRWTIKQVGAGLVDSQQTRWEKDLDSTIERVYSNKFSLGGAWKRPVISDVEVRALLVPVRKRLSRLVMAHILRFAKSLGTETFFLSLGQIADALYPELTEEQRIGRRTRVSNAIKDLVSLGVLEVVEASTRERATVYRLAKVKERGATFYPACGREETCANCDLVLLGQLLNESELRDLVSRRSLNRIKAERRACSP